MFRNENRSDTPNTRQGFKRFEDELAPDGDPESRTNYNSISSEAPLNVKTITQRQGSGLIIALSGHRPTLYINIALFLISLLFLITCLTISIPVKAGQEQLASTFNQTTNYVKDVLISKTNEIESKNKEIASKDNELFEARRAITQLQESQKREISTKDNEIFEARKQIAQLQASVKSKDNEIENLNEKLSQNSDSSAASWFNHLFNGANSVAPSHCVMAFSLCLTVLFMMKSA